MKYLSVPALAVAAFVATAVNSEAHFQMLAPAGWLVEKNDLGDPQKLAPCGGTSADKGTPSNIVTQIQGGSSIHLKLHEAIFHPGHYRVALAVQSRSELPPDPEVATRDTPMGPISVSAKIPDAKMPILADGLFAHSMKPAPDTYWEADVKLPNINCDDCTLQVVQFMAEHARNPDGDFSYHHCADLHITANPALPIDKKWPGQ